MDKQVLKKISYDRDQFIIDPAISDIFSAAVDKLKDKNRKLFNCVCSDEILKENFNNCDCVIETLAYLNTAGSKGTINKSITFKLQFIQTLQVIILDPPNYLYNIPNNKKDKIKLIRSLTSYIHNLTK